MKAERTGGREGKGDRNSGDESVEAEGMEVGFAYRRPDRHPVPVSADTGTQ